MTERHAILTRTVPAGSGRHLTSHERRKLRALGFRVPEDGVVVQDGDATRGTVHVPLNRGQLATRNIHVSVNREAPNGDNS